MIGVAAFLPAYVQVAIVGAGYAGLSTAIELADQGVSATVIEANEPGFGASTRSGGAVSGGVNVGKSFSGKSIDPGSERAAHAAYQDHAVAEKLQRQHRLRRSQLVHEQPGKPAAANGGVRLIRQLRSNLASCATAPRCRFQ